MSGTVQFTAGGPDGTIIVAWKQTTAAGTQVFGAVRPSGGAWVYLEPLPPDALPTSVAIDPAGNVLTVWTATAAVLAEAHLHVAASQKRRQLSVAVPEIQDDSQRRVLLSMRHQEVQQEALAAPCGSEHECVPDVLDMQVEGVWCVVRRLEDR